MTRRVPLLPALAALALIAAAGAPTLARLAWLAGLPEVTLVLTRDPGVRGAALYRAGNYGEADAVFADIGRGATYNRAATLAATGDYALSRAYYNAVLFADRWDGEARANRDLVAALIEPVVGEAMGHGRIAVRLAESGATARDFDPDDPSAPTVIAGQRLRRPVDARAVHADIGWLDTLADAPGDYLQRRLSAEYERRVETGLAHPPEADPW